MVAASGFQKKDNKKQVSVANYQVTPPKNLVSTWGLATMDEAFREISKATGLDQKDGKK